MADADVVGAARERLGSVGVWLASLRPAPIEEERHAARRIEQLGYGSLWSGELLGGKEAFTHLGLLLAATEHLIGGTGIANVWARLPATMQGASNTLGAAYPGRFVLGVGVSHAPMVNRAGQVYERPLAYMKGYLDGMDAAAVDSPDTEVPVPRLLAALRPQMLALARDRADGAHPYFVPTAHTSTAREVLGPERLLVPEQAVVLERDPSEARRIAREHTVRYLQLENYVNNLHHLGFDEEDTAGAGSDRLVDAVVAWGDEDAIAQRVREHLDAGADHVLIQPLGDLGQAMRQLEQLAPAVLRA